MTTSLRRRRGRPPIREGDRTVNLSVRVSTSQFDVLYAQARQARMTLAQWVRRRLQVPPSGSQ